MKVCTKCQIPKEEGLFSKKGPRLRAICRECDSEYGKGNYGRNRIYYARYCKERYDEMVEWLNWLKDVPCTDCGLRWPPEAMDFDHVCGTKKFNIAGSALRSPTKLQEEVEKCEVVCACCHRIRTKARRNVVPALWNTETSIVCWHGSLLSLGSTGPKVSYG